MVYEKYPEWQTELKNILDTFKEKRFCFRAVHRLNCMRVRQTFQDRDLKSESSRGQMRETFFVNQLKGVAKITAGVVGDFTIDGKHHFEVGGKGKTFRQLQGAENGYVVADQIEIGHGNKIPLYLFGFLY